MRRFGKLGLGEEKRQEIVERVMRLGTCQGIVEIPADVRSVLSYQVISPQKSMSACKRRSRHSLTIRFRRP